MASNSQGFNHLLDQATAARPARPMKRSRTTFSCTSCRVSKIKCDRAEKEAGQPCTPCRMRGKQCINQGDEGDNGDVALPISPPHQNYAAPPVQSSSRQRGAPLSHSSSREEPRDDKIMDMLVEIRSLLLTNGSNQSPTPSQNAEPLEAPDFPSHMASKQYLIGGGLPNDGGPIRDEITCYVLLRPALAMLPSKDTLDKCIDAFFTEGQVLETYVDEKSFRARWLAIEIARAHSLDPLYTFEDATTLATTFMALACNLLYLSHCHPSVLAIQAEVGPSFEPTNQSDIYMATSRWISSKATFERASAAINSPSGQSIFCMPPASLDQLELLLVETQNLCFSKSNTEAIWKRVTLAVSAALELNLHRKGGTDAADIARRTRLWFHVFSMDKYASFMGQRPFMLQWSAHDVPLPQSGPNSSSSDKFQEVRARYGKLLAELASFNKVAIPLPTVRRLVKETDAWWEVCRSMGFASTQMELVTSLLNHSDFEEHARGRRNLAVYAQKCHMTMLLCRNYTFSDDDDSSCAAERKLAMDSTRDIVQLFTMIVSIWQMLSKEQRDLLPLNTVLSWTSFAAFDSVLILLWVLCGREAGPDRDSLTSLVVQGRNTYAFVAENGVKVGHRATAVIDTLLPFVATPQEGAKKLKERRQELAAIVRSVLSGKPVDAAEPLPRRTDSSSSSNTPSLSFVSTPGSNHAGSPHDIPLTDTPWPAFDNNMYMLGLSWQNFLDSADTNTQPFM